MSKFFESDIVRKNLEEIFKTYSEISDSQFWLPRMNKQEREDHINRTKGLIEKQNLFYLRLKLAAQDGDSEAHEMVERITTLVQTFGYKDLPHCLESLIETLDRALAGS